MMNKYKLTVAIPTYNRSVELSETLKVILPQIRRNHNVQLLILDNCSKTPAELILSKIVGDWKSDRVSVVRHPANIGGVYNILRTFELAEGEWLWCLSDDDTPAFDAVETILADCESGSHCYAYYGLKDGVPNVSDCLDGKYIGNSIHEWVRRVPAYGERLFISESVFKISAMQPYMSLAHIVASSGAPHLVLAYCAVTSGGRYLLSCKQIAKYNIPNGGGGYNFARLAYGTALLALVRTKGSPSDYKEFFLDSYQNWISPKLFVRHLLALNNQTSNTLLAREFSVIARIMRPRLWSNPCLWFKWVICQVVVRLPVRIRNILI